jgi:hypothetical protein
VPGGGNGGGGCPVGGCIPAPTLPVVPDPVAIKKAVSQAAGDATANSLRQTAAAIINSNPGLSDQAKNTIGQKLNNYANFVAGGCSSAGVLNENCP